MPIAHSDRFLLVVVGQNDTVETRFCCCYRAVQSWGRLQVGRAGTRQVSRRTKLGLRLAHQPPDGQRRRQLERENQRDHGADPDVQ